MKRSRKMRAPEAIGCVAVALLAAGAAGCAHEQGVQGPAAAPPPGSAIALRVDRVEDGESIVCIDATVKRAQGQRVAGAWIGSNGGACGSGWQARMVRVDGVYWRPDVAPPLQTDSHLHVCVHRARPAVKQALEQEDLALYMSLEEAPRCIVVPVMTPAH